MAVNERFYDDSNFLPVGSPMPEPRNAGMLLSELKLVTADRDAQIAGMREWLQDHEPSPGLLRSFKRRGFTELLTHSV